MNYIRPLSFMLALLLVQLPLSAGLIAIDSGAGIGNAPSVYSIDSGTGSATRIGGINDGFVAGPGSYIFDDTFGLAKNSVGELYTVATAYTGLAGIEPLLVRIDPLTGQGTFVAKLDKTVFFSPRNLVRALAFAPGGTLYGVAETTKPGGGSSDALYTIDIVTGNETVMGYLDMLRMDSMAFASDGTLFGWQSGFSFFGSVTPGRGLVTIDTTSAAVTNVNGLEDSLSSNEIKSITFDGNGQLIGAGTSLFHIDRSSGVATAVGATGQYLEGVESLHALHAVPEPATLASVGCFLVFGLFRRRRRS